MPIDRDVLYSGERRRIGARRSTSEGLFHNGGGWAIREDRAASWAPCYGA
ncbi:MAG: hypothetical protein OXG81_10845 [Acidobacteria bacterium]|nr:hypothetical protein [Acidobacteriota bacterium]